MDKAYSLYKNTKCLNPCFSGGWSRSYLSQMQIYEFSVSANMFFEDISEFFCVDA